MGGAIAQVDDGYTDGATVAPRGVCATGLAALPDGPNAGHLRPVQEEPTEEHIIGDGSSDRIVV